MKQIDWKKVADYLYRYGLDEANRGMEQRAKGNMDVSNRLIINGNICITLAAALREGLE